MNIIGWVVNKVKNIFSNLGVRAFSMMYYGTIVSFRYLNFKHDPNPMIFIMYSGQQYTHGLNFHYMSDTDKQWFGNMIYLIKKGNQILDGRTLYMMLKSQRPSIIRSCYRKYHTGMIQGPRMVSAGFTPMKKLEQRSTDPFIEALNKHLTPEIQPAYSVKVAYYDEELKDRIIKSQHATPIGSATTSATTPIQPASQQQNVQQPASTGAQQV